DLPGDLAGVVGDVEARDAAHAGAAGEHGLGNVRVVVPQRRGGADAGDPDGVPVTHHGASTRASIGSAGTRRAGPRGAGRGAGAARSSSSRMPPGRSRSTVVCGRPGTVSASSTAASRAGDSSGGGPASAFAPAADASTAIRSRTAA